MATNMGSLKATIAAAIDKSSFEKANQLGRKLVDEKIKQALELDTTKAYREAASFKKSAEVLFGKDIKQKVDVDTSTIGSKAKAAGSSLASGMATAFSAKRVLIAGAVTSALAVLPMAVTGAGILAGAALGAGLVAALIKVNPKIQAAGKSLGKSLENTLNSAANSTGFTSKIVSAINQIKTKALPALKPAFEAAFKALGPLVKPATDAIVNLANWIGKHANGAINDFKGYVSQLKGPVGNLVDKLKGSVWQNVAKFLGEMSQNSGKSVTAFGNLLGVIAPLLPPLGKVAGFAATLIGQFPQLSAILLIGAGAFGKIQGAIKLATGVWKGLNIVMDTNVFVLIGIAVVVLAILIVKYHKQIWNAIKSCWDHVWNDALKPAISWFTQSVPHAAGVLVNALAGAWHSVENTAKNVWGSITAFFSSAWSGIKGIFNSALGWVKSSTSGAWHAVFNTTKSVFGSVTSFFSGFWGGIRKGFSDLVGDVKSIWGGISDAVKSPLHIMDSKIYEPFASIVNKGLGIFGVSAKLPKTLGLATGGYVSGEGSGIADKVPAALSHGEYVMKASTVRKVGKKNLDALNGNSGRQHGGGQAYATGGQVMSDATQWKGHKYVWGGGANPQTGWDCSSFVSYILGGKNGVPLPGGFKAPSNQHGPTADQFRNGSAISGDKTSPGDLAVEKDGGHVGLLMGGGTKNLVQGFAAIGKAYGTNYQQFPSDSFDFYHTPEVDDRGELGKIWDGVKGAAGSALSFLANTALGGISGLLGKIGSGGKTIPGQLAAGVPKTMINAAISALKGNSSNYTAGYAGTNGLGGDNAAPGVGTSGSQLANGKAIYSYLLDHLFNGSEIAAAGATASIGGESSWNPFAQGTGGRGLIGWTPPSKISDAVFKGGLATQLPAIIDFVQGNDDMGVIAKMESAGNVLSAANLWGKGVERYGVNDVHSQFVSLATSFMNKNASKVKTGQHTGMAAGGIFHNPTGNLRADSWNVPLSDGERILPRAQAKDYGKAPAQYTPAELAIIQRLDKIHAATNQTATATSNSAKALGGVNRVRRTH